MFTLQRLILQVPGLIPYGCPEGIDPSLFWEHDGKCYYTGMKGPKKKQSKDQCMIYNQELNLQQQKLVGKKHILTYGHANNASYSEDPHLYKIKD
ncbi:family 43 glycosylhydrolase [Labilibaculum antarcticum]|uniref:family 43 glycosylhydrolase n=1 Tax=Labilibaculum antarcticum TaxID=1717717 RepID=UPI000BBAF1EB